MSQQQPHPRRLGRRVRRIRRRRQVRAHLRAALAGAFALVLAAVALVGAATLAGSGRPPAGDPQAAPATPGPAVATAPVAQQPPERAAPTTPGPSAPATDGPATGAGGAPPGTAATATATRYRVRAGDTLSAIAGLHALEAADVAGANDLRPPYDLTPGQWLEVPFPEGDAADPPTTHPPHDAEVRRAIDRWATANDVPAALLAAVLWRESSWDPAARSDVGAIGVGQLMPGTARWVSDELIGAPLDPARVEDNVQLSSRLLRFLIDDADGDQAAALAAYYQGSAATERDGWYGETSRYVASVFDLRWRFASEMGIR